MKAMTESDENEYCVECGDPEFDEDGKETHASDDYDHDFEPEEEDDGLTLDDVKKGAETISSIAKAVKDIKDLSDDPKLEITKAGDEAVKKARKKGFAGHEVPQPHTNWLWDTLRPPAPDERKTGTWDRYLFKVRKPRSE